MRGLYGGTILILGADDDDHADHVYQYFITHGRDVEFLDSRLFPSVTGISYDPATGRGAIRLPDGRRLATAEIEPVELPPEVRSQCVEIAKTLDLRWTGIDFRRTRQGQYVFLEANPSPMFLGFEERTGLPLTESLAAVLTGDD